MDTSQGSMRLVELRFDSEGGAIKAIELARLKPCGDQVEREVPLRAPAPVVVKAAAVERWESAVYLVVVQQGEVKQVGRLSSFLDGLSRPLEEEEEEEVEEEEEEEEEEEDLSSYSEEDSSSIKLRICPRLSRLILVLFVGGNWRLSRRCEINWLEDGDKANIAKVLIDEMQDEPDVLEEDAELKKEKLKNAATIKELQEKAEQKLQDELQRKDQEIRQQIEKAQEIAKAEHAAVAKEKASQIEQIIEANLYDLTGAVAVEQKSLAETYLLQDEPDISKALTIKEKRSDKVVHEEASEDGKIVPDNIGAIHAAADIDAYMYSEEGGKLKELKKEKLKNVVAKELQEKAEQKLQDELQMKDEETSQQIEKAQEIAKAELAATVAKEKASQIEQIAESNLNVWLEFEGIVLNEKLMCAQFNASMRDFIVLKVLGKGAAGKVYQCVYRNDPIAEVQYALKKMDVSDDFDDIEAILGEEPREVSILSYLEDDFVVSFYQAWAANGEYKSYLSSDGEEESSDDEKYSLDEDYSMKFGVLEPRYVIIQMEFCQRALKDDLPFGDREINIEESWSVFEEITRGLQCMHRTGIIHRDLKPDNIFVGTNGTIKIGDMGHACWAKTDERIRTPNRGTSLYNSPEMDTGHNVTIKADIYSIGVIFMELFYPFSTYLGEDKAVSEIKNNMQPPTDWKGDTKLLMQLMAPCPSDRPSTEEILDYIAERRKTIDSQ